MIVKIMSGEDLPDHDNRKRFSLIADVAEIAFHREGGFPVVEIYRIGNGRDSERYTPNGNVYVMTDAGKTIDSFAHMAPPELEPVGKNRKTA